MSGPGYGQNGGRQQRKRPREFEEEQYRRTRTVDTIERLKRDLVNLSDPGNVPPIEDIRYVARKIAVDYETPENQGRIINVLQDCILELSIKTCHYAAVIVLAGAQNKAFGDAFMLGISTWLPQAYEARHWRDVKLLLRLLASMNRCLTTNSTTTLSILQDLISRLVEADFKVATESGDRICEILMLTLPYLIVASDASDMQCREVASSLVNGIEPYMRIRAASPQTSSRSPDSLVLLQRQCEHASATGWKVDYLPEFFELFGPDSAIVSYELPAVILPALDSAERVLDHSSRSLQIFNEQAVQSVPASNNLAYSVFRDQVSDVLDTLVANRKDAARFLIDLESYVQPGIFVLRGTPLDKISPEGPTWKAEDIVVESIFSELLALPSPRHKTVYYHSVLTELCKLVPQAVAPTFGRAIRAIYGNLEHMEPELAYRFWDWFSHHLSNFGFNWKWQEWIPDLSLPALHPKSVFIRESIRKEAELSYNQRIKTTLPIEYHGLIADEAPGPDFQYLQAEHLFYTDAVALMEALSSDAQIDTIPNIISNISTKAAEQGLDSDHETASMLIQSVLQLGHQSFSHALNTIERNLNLLQSHCDANPSTRRSTVSAVLQFWNGRPFIASTLLQKLLNYRIISPLSVLEVVLESGDVSSSVTWELLETTVDKVEKRVMQVQDRLACRNNPEPDAPEKAVERERLEKTWVDVQAEQREVLTFTLRHFLARLDNLGGDAEEWTEYWTKGIFASFLRRHRLQITKLEDEIIKDSRLAELGLIMHLD